MDPRDLHAVRLKLVAGFTANTARTFSGLSVGHDTQKSNDKGSGSNVFLECS